MTEFITADQVNTGDSQVFRLEYNDSEKKNNHDKNISLAIINVNEDEGLRAKLQF
jgi:hypothetical protein